MNRNWQKIRQSTLWSKEIRCMAARNNVRKVSRNGNIWMCHVHRFMSARSTSWSVKVHIHMNNYITCNVNVMFLQSSEWHFILPNHTMSTRQWIVRSLTLYYSKRLEGRHFIWFSLIVSISRREWPSIYCYPSFLLINSPLSITHHSHPHTTCSFLIPYACLLAPLNLRSFFLC